MLTGISGSKTVFRASTMPFSMSVSVSSMAGDLLSASFGGDGLLLLLQRGFEGMPREGGAFDADGELAHPGEHGELAQRAGISLTAGDQAVEALEQRVRLGHGLALERLGHQRGRGGRDGAPGALERDVLHAVSRDVEEDLQAVAAERIVPHGRAVRIRQGAEIPRPPVVVEDDLLIEVAQLVALEAH